MKKTVNKNLIKQAVVASLANIRQSTSHTKTRGNVSGGGKKPWRQKGTGRARAGSSRSPIWVGGGITFGPTSEQNFKQHLPVKMRKKALAEILSVLKENDQIKVVDKIEIKEVKTKEVVKLLADNGVLGKKVTIITNEINKDLVKSARNIPNITVTTNIELSILSVANAGAVLIEKDSAIARGLLVEPKKVTPKKAK